MTVGVRELKAHLSAHLRRVQGGVTLTITDRGEAVARLVPVQETAPPAWLRRLLAERRVSWAGGKPVGMTSPVKSKGKPTSEMVIEDRR